MSGRVGDRVALVTGAGTGIGRATAIRLAEEGATVVVTSRTPANADETCDLIEGAGLPRPASIGLDVTDPSRVEEVVAGVVGEHGRIDIVVANAGVELTHAPSVEDTRDDEWARLFDVNVGGIFRICRAALPAMPDGGSIVTVGSINSFVAWPNDAAYTATKGAVLQFTRALSLETAERGIRVELRVPRGDRHTADARVPHRRRRSTERSRSSSPTRRRSVAWARRERSRTRSCSSRRTKRRS